MMVIELDGRFYMSTSGAVTAALVELAKVDPALHPDVVRAAGSGLSVAKIRRQAALVARSRCAVRVAEHGTHRFAIPEGERGVWLRRYLESDYLAATVNKAMREGREPDYGAPLRAVEVYALERGVPDPLGDARRRAAGEEVKAKPAEREDPEELPPGAAEASVSGDLPGGDAESQGGGEQAPRTGRTRRKRHERKEAGDDPMPGSTGD